MHTLRGSLSKRIRSIPAAQSEYAAITGQDPCMLAQLAFKDAQRAATIRPSWAKCFLLQVKRAHLHACLRHCKPVCARCHGLRVTCNACCCQWSCAHGA